MADRGDKSDVTDMDVDDAAAATESAGSDVSLRMDAAMSRLSNSMRQSEHAAHMSRMSRAAGQLQESMADATNSILASSSYRKMCEEQDKLFDPAEAEASDKRAIETWNAKREKYELELNEAIEWMTANKKWPDGDSLIEAGDFREKDGHTFADVDPGLPTWVQQVLTAWNQSSDMVDGLYGSHRIIRRVKNGHLVKLLLLIDRDEALAPLKRRMVEFAEAEGGECFLPARFASSHM